MQSGLFSLVKDEQGREIRFQEKVWLPDGMNDRYALDYVKYFNQQHQSEGVFCEFLESEAHFRVVASSEALLKELAGLLNTYLVHVDPTPLVRASFNSR